MLKTLTILLFLCFTGQIHGQEIEDFSTVIHLHEEATGAISMNTPERRNSSNQYDNLFLNVFTKTKVYSDFSGYDYSSELGFFCKFEDKIARRSKIKIDLGITGY